MKLDKKLLPIKAHYFFFMAAMGPILPQMPVFAKNLGVPPDAMGLITSVLPILYVLAKPAVGFLADYYVAYRKLIFVLITIITAACFAGFEIIPHSIKYFAESSESFNVTLLDENRDLNQCYFKIDSHMTPSYSGQYIQCRTPDGHIYDLTRHKYADTLQRNQTFAYNLCFEQLFAKFKNVSHLECMVDEKKLPDRFYSSVPFWIFVLFMCIGTVGFNVTNCFSDAICFDMLGKSQETKYGVQRVWGTIGFGITALLAGLFTEEVEDGEVHGMTAAIIIMLIASSVDLLFVVKLKLPKLSTADSIVLEVWSLMRQPSIAIFLVFATIAGIVDSFIIYFMFWHLEEVAAETGYMKSIKLIEGCVVAAECLGGEILFFLMSGKILKRLGYVHCLSLCFFTYSIRLGLISLIPNPWWLVVVEFFMQGCTYALCYTCIVAYASAIAPPGTSATVQGIVAGMDDGLGFSIGSLVGGQLYKYVGGTRSFQIFAALAFTTFFAHICFRPSNKHESQVAALSYQLPTEQIKMSQNTLNTSHLPTQSS